MRSAIGSREAMTTLSTKFMEAQFDLQVEEEDNSLYVFVKDKRCLLFGLVNFRPDDEELKNNEETNPIFAMKQLIESLYRTDKELLVAFDSHNPQQKEEEKKETKKPTKPTPKKIKKIEEEKKATPGP